jgi:hypothetical protein
MSKGSGNAQAGKCFLSQPSMSTFTTSAAPLFGLNLASIAPLSFPLQEHVFPGPRPINPYWSLKISEWDWSVEHSPNMCETLGSIYSTVKAKQNKT